MDASKVKWFFILVAIATLIGFGLATIIAVSVFGFRLNLKDVVTVFAGFIVFMLPVFCVMYFRSIRRRKKGSR